MEKHKNSKPLFHKSALRLSTIYKGLLLVVILTIVFGENLKAKIGQISKPSSNDYNSQDIAGISSLMNAVNNGDVEGVKFFVSAGDNIVNQKNIGGATALHIAARNGNVEIFNILINNGADINDTDNEGWTALMRASSFKHPEIVAILVNKNVETGKLNSFKESALIHSANSECLECLGIIIDKFNYNSIGLNILKDQINEASYIAKKKDNVPMQQLLASFLAKVNSLPSNYNKFIKNDKSDNGVLEKIYNFMGKPNEKSKNDKPLENKSLPKQPSPILPVVIQKDEPAQSIIPSKKLDKKAPITYLFLGNKFSKYYKPPQTPVPSLPIKKDSSELKPEIIKQDSSAKNLTPAPLQDQKTDKLKINKEEVVIYNLGEKSDIRDKSIQAELPNDKSVNSYASSSNEKKYNFLGKKHIPYKIKPLSKKNEVTPVVVNQNTSANSVPVPVNPATNKVNQIPANPVSPINNAPKVESNNVPAINASAKSPVAPPPPPVKKVNNPAAPVPVVATPTNPEKPEANNANPPLPDMDKFNVDAQVKK